MKRATPWSKRASFFLGLTVLLVAVSDWLFYKQPAGWNTGLWELAVTFVLILTHRDTLRT